MKKETRDQWVADLRSGNYKQCRTSLKRVNEDGNESFCCLGVLAYKSTDLSKQEDFEEHFGYGKIQEVTGVDNQELWWLNDGSGGFKRHSFPEIADWIEKNIPVDG